MHLDEALQMLGAYGRYQVLMFMAISLFDNLPSIWHMNVGTFLNFEPNHHCKVRRSIRLYMRGGVGYCIGIVVKASRWQL